ncbi:MAG: ADOP family duplicated permease [Longimicrobiales bacterium]
MSGERGWGRLRRLFGSDPEKDVEDELTFHLEMRRRDYERRGLDSDAADAAARERFGDVDRLRSVLERDDERGRRSGRRRAWLGEVRQDVRYGVRMVMRTPLVFGVVVATLALGVGATTAIFSVVNAVLLRPLPYAEPEGIARLWEISPRGEDHNVISEGNYLAWRARATSFSELGAHRWEYGVALTGDGDPVRLLTSDITPSAMAVLGVAPVLGRGFTPEDGRPGTRVILLSHDLWRSRYGADRGVLERTLTLDGLSYTVIGVMPPDFDFPTSNPDVWRPLTDDAFDPSEHRSHNYYVIGRLKPNVTLAAAQSEMRAIAANLGREQPQYMTEWSVNVTPLHADLVRDVRPMLWVLLAGVGVVLMIACANIASLLLARALAREREMAVRGALGAGRARLVRQALTESLLLAVAGGALGMLCARLVLGGLLALAPPDIPLIDEVRLDPRVFAFAAGATLLSTLLFGLFPALRLAYTDLQVTLRGTDARAGGVPHARLRGALLVAEVALSLVLLSGAGLLVRSASRINAIDYGYEPEGLLAVFLSLPYARYDTTTAHQEFYAKLIERVATIPDVASVGGTSEPPAAGYSMTFGYAIEGRPSSNASGREDPRPLRVVTPDYFHTMGLPLLSGRTFEPGDRAGAPDVAIVNESLARLHWPNESPVGKRISLAGAEGPWKQIVGVVEDARMTSADEPPSPAFYMPHAQKPWNWLSWLTLIIRADARVDPTTLAPRIRSAVWELDAQLPLQRVATIEHLYGESLARRRFATTLLVGFALVALVLGVIGMYGVLAYSVAQRRRDIGIRMALGASRGKVVGDVIRHALKLAALGVVLGTAASLAVTRMLRTLLYEVSPTDPTTLVSVGMLVVMVALFAAWLPATRAARVSPLGVIRDA